MYAPGMRALALVFAMSCAAEPPMVVDHARPCVDLIARCGPVPLAGSADTPRWITCARFALNEIVVTVP